MQLEGARADDVSARMRRRPFARDRIDLPRRGKILKALVGLLLSACLGVGSAAAQTSTTIVTRTNTTAVYGHTSNYGTSTKIVTRPSWGHTTVTTTYQRNTQGRYQPMGAGGYRPMGR